MVGSGRVEKVSSHEETLRERSTLEQAATLIVNNSLTGDYNISTEHGTTS